MNCLWFLCIEKVSEAGGWLVVFVFMQFTGDSQAIRGWITCGERDGGSGGSYTPYRGSVVSWMVVLVILEREERFDAR